jgi:hypothetical protein
MGLLGLVVVFEGVSMLEEVVAIDNRALALLVFPKYLNDFSKGPKL